MRRGTVVVRVAGAALAVIISACSASDTARQRDQRHDIDAYITRYDLRGLAEVLPATSGAEHDYVAGILATRSGRIDEAIRSLNQALPAIRASHPERAAIALKALANVYSMAYRYEEAARTYDDLERNFSSFAADVADDAALARIVRNVPAQTVSAFAALRLPTERNVIGSLSGALTVNGVTAPWLLDTGANQSVVTQSFADRLGLTPLPGTALVGSGLTGRKSPFRVAVVPRLQIGEVIVSNVIVLILEDANLTIGTGADSFRLDAILGYPALKGLGRIAFTSGQEFLAGDAVAQRPGVPLYMSGLIPAIECVVNDRPLLMTFDTGANNATLSIRYYELFREEQRTWTKHTVQTFGAGGMVDEDVYVQPEVVMTIGDTTVTLRDVGINSTAKNGSIDRLFGNLGQDLFADREDVTIDFAAMTFSLGAPIPASR